ncbi:MAG TPA: TetR/AcrR family transcriptional regulator [Anaerolineae bacterium]|nr:TetR/AcrR family transcriptional regulator [Anaerolineae bacterium]
MKTADKRTLRTRTRLREALIDLLMAKDYESITIRDITQRAGVGYATFFRHYASKDDLLVDAFQESVAQLESLLQAMGTSGSPAEEGRLIFEHVAAHHDLYRVFLRGEGTQSLVDEALREGVKELVMTYARYTPSIPAAILANHVVASVIALVKWWLRNDMPFPPERMGEIYARMIIEPVETLLHA